MPALSTWSALASVFIGGVGGTAARYEVEAAFPHDAADWPWGTFGVNVVGALLLGIVLESVARRGPEDAARRGPEDAARRGPEDASMQRMRLFVATGFLGAFTTYSTFALESVLLADGGHWLTALCYMVASVVVGTSAAWLGIEIGARLIPGRHVESA